MSQAIRESGLPCNEIFLTSKLWLQDYGYEGAIIFPKSTKPERIRSNMEIFDFALTEAEMNAIRALDTGKGCFDHDAPGVAKFLIRAFDVHADD